MSPSDLEQHFSPAMEGKFMHRDGPARAKSKVYSNSKLCITATDKEALIAELYALSLREECYYVKYSTRPRDGMYLGRCFVTTDAVVGELWCQLKQHPKFYCSVQDDTFTKSFHT